MDVRVQVPPSAPTFLLTDAYARVVELADSLDSGSSVLHARAGSSPASRTIKETSFVYQGKRGFFLHFGQKTSTDQKRRHRGRIQMRRGDRAGIREISSSPQTVGNSGFTGPISFQPVEKFIFSGYNITREGSDKSGFVRLFDSTKTSGK